MDVLNRKPLIKQLIKSFIQSERLREITKRNNPLYRPEWDISVESIELGEALKSLENTNFVLKKYPEALSTGSWANIASHSPEHAQAVLEKMSKKFKEKPGWLWRIGEKTSHHAKLILDNFRENLDHNTITSLEALIQRNKCHSR